MSKRRVDELESSMSAKEAVLHWLAEAHAYGTLPAYAASLIDQPDSVQPFVALPTKVEEAVWRSRRGQRTGSVKEAMREAVTDTVFLLRLVIGINVHLEETLRIEGLRRAALYWWSRALDGARKDDDRMSDWRRGVSTHRAELIGTEAARAAAEARYLDGRDCLFPELSGEWRGLCATAELMAETEPAAEPARQIAEQNVRRVVLMARADGLDASGRWEHADDLAVRVARTLVGEGADG